MDVAFYTRNMLLVWLLMIPIISGFSSSVGKTKFAVNQVNSFADVRALADLRYNEWIVGSAEDKRKQPSIDAFRMATAEIHQERQEQGAIAFIAKCKETDLAVGSAELSPIELHNCCNSDIPYLYITDVVTSSSYRRQGIGKKLLHCMESEAINLGVTRICLHVDKENNDAAFQFYIQNGYAENDEKKELLLNESKLAENAGTVGQKLLTKVLEVPKKKIRRNTALNSNGN